MRLAACVLVIALATPAPASAHGRAGEVVISLVGLVSVTIMAFKLRRVERQLGDCQRRDRARR